MKAMGLYRSEAVTENDGHQAITSTFDIEDHTGTPLRLERA
jgi:hypothetical protein